MPRIGLAYERPSRGSQALIVGFSLAVVFMAGWLVLMIMFSHDGNTTTADTAVLSPPSAAPPRIENLPPAAQPSTARLLTPLPESTPWPDTQPAALPMSLPSRAPAAAPVAAPPAAYATSSLTTPSINDRVAPAEDPITTETEPAEIVPLPPPRPRRVASIPVPRPRPKIDEPAEPPQRNLFDFLIDRQR